MYGLGLDSTSPAFVFFFPWLFILIIIIPRPLSSTSQDSRAGQLISTKRQCFTLVLACGDASHREFTPPASSRETLSTRLTPNVLVIHHFSQNPPRNTPLSSGAPCSQPPLDSLISQRRAPKAKLLRSPPLPRFLLFLPEQTGLSK